MWTFQNLALIIAIIAIVIVIKRHLPFWNWLLALVSTLIVIVGSAAIYSPGYGYGGYLMLTLPFAPVIFILIWVFYAAAGLISILFKNSRS